MQYQMSSGGLFDLRGTVLRFGDGGGGEGFGEQTEQFGDAERLLEEAAALAGDSLTVRGIDQVAGHEDEGRGGALLRREALGNALVQLKAGDGPARLRPEMNIAEDRVVRIMGESFASLFGRGDALDGHAARGQ